MVIESLSFALHVKRQTPGKEKFTVSGNKEQVNMIILSTHERKYETKTFNKKIRTCRLPFPEMCSLNSLVTESMNSQVSHWDTRQGYVPFYGNESCGEEL
jgi:hypothetical protein